MSLADVAGSDVSRTMIHFIEHGRARPSERVLELIAERTGKPVSYFLVSPAEASSGDAEELLSRQLTTIANLVRRFTAGGRLTKPEREAMKLVEVNLRQAVVLTRALESKSG